MQEETGGEIVTDHHLDPPSPSAMPKRAADSRTLKRVASTSRRDIWPSAPLTASRHQHSLKASVRLPRGRAMAGTRGAAQGASGASLT